MPNQHDHPDKSPAATDEERREMMEIISKQARLSRSRTKLTQRDVAERIDLVDKVYGRLERGKMLPSVGTLRKLALALGTSADELLALKPEDLAPRTPRPRPPDDNPDIRRLIRKVSKLSRRNLWLLLLLAEAISEQEAPPVELEEGSADPEDGGAEPDPEE